MALSEDRTEPAMAKGICARAHRRSSGGGYEAQKGGTQSIVAANALVDAAEKLEWEDRQRAEWRQRTHKYEAKRRELRASAQQASARTELVALIAVVDGRPPNPMVSKTVARMAQRDALKLAAVLLNMSENLFKRWRQLVFVASFALFKTLTRVAEVQVIPLIESLMASGLSASGSGSSGSDAGSASAMLKIA
ncbi:hypothetical protein T492DRAFT_873975 [Pavlovales sp. CCMP2436]|nr:hypothetical protein T492DRAFT_873975 [Pavlovales sp. CCMP2436]